MFSFSKIFLLYYNINIPIKTDQPLLSQFSNPLSVISFQLSVNSNSQLLFYRQQVTSSQFSIFTYPSNSSNTSNPSNPLNNSPQWNVLQIAAAIVSQRSVTLLTLPTLPTFLTLITTTTGSINCRPTTKCPTAQRNT